MAEAAEHGHGEAKQETPVVTPEMAHRWFRAGLANTPPKELPHELQPPRRRLRRRQGPTAAAPIFAEAVAGGAARAALMASRELRLASNALTLVMSVPDTDDAAGRTTQPEEASDFAAALGRPEVARALDDFETQASAGIDDAFSRFRPEALDAVAVAAALDVKSVEPASDRAFVPPVLAKDSSPETIVLTTLITAAAANWTPAACACCMAALSLLGDPLPGQVALPAPVVTRHGAGGWSLPGWTTLSGGVSWLINVITEDALEWISNKASEYEARFQNTLGEDPMTNDRASLMNMAFGLTYNGIIMPIFQGGRGLFGTLWTFVTELCGWGPADTTFSWAAIKAGVGGVVGSGGVLTKLFGAAFQGGQLWALYFGMRSYFTLFTLRMGPLLNGALALTLVSLANAGRLGGENDFADRLWKYLEQNTTFDKAEKDFASPGSYGHSVLAMGVCLSRTLLGLAGEASKPFAWLGGLTSAMGSCAAAFATAAKVDIGARLVPTVTLAGIAAPLRLLFDMSGCSIMLGPALVLVMCCTGFGRMGQEGRAPRFRELAVACATAAGAGILAYAVLATPVFACLTGPAAVLFVETQGAYDTYVEMLRAGFFFGVPTLCAAFAAAVTDSVIDDLDELALRYRERGVRGVLQHVTTSSIYRNVLGGQDEEQDERTLYLGRAMAAMRMLATALVDTKAIEAVGEKEDIDAAAELLGVRLPI